MSEQFTGGEVHSIKETRIARSRPSSIRFAKLLLSGLAAMLLLGIEAAFAICVCGEDSVTDPPPREALASPQKDLRPAPADCPSPAELTLRVTVVPFGDPGRFNLEINRGRVDQCGQRGIDRTSHRSIWRTHSDRNRRKRGTTWPTIAQRPAARAPWAVPFSWVPGKQEAARLQISVRPLLLRPGKFRQRGGLVSLGILVRTRPAPA